MKPIPTSTKSYKELSQEFPNVSRNLLNFSILNCFHILPHQRIALEIYRVQKVTGEEFNNLNNNGIIKSNGKEFQVIFQGTGPYEAKRSSSVILSFRAAKSDFNIPATVIVKIDRNNVY